MIPRYDHERREIPQSTAIRKMRERVSTQRVYELTRDDLEKQLRVLRLFTFHIVSAVSKIANLNFWKI